MDNEAVGRKLPLLLQLLKHGFISMKYVKNNVFISIMESQNFDTLLLKGNELQKPSEARYVMIFYTYVEHKYKIYLEYTNSIK